MWPGYDLGQPFQHATKRIPITDAWSPIGCDWRSAVAARLQKSEKDCGKDREIPNDKVETLEVWRRTWLREQTVLLVLAEPRNWGQQIEVQKRGLSRIQAGELLLKNASKLRRIPGKRWESSFDWNLHAWLHQCKIHHRTTDARSPTRVNGARAANLGMQD